MFTMKQVVSSGSQVSALLSGDARLESLIILQNIYLQQEIFS
jgi:hypothetical protein